MGTRTPAGACRTCLISADLSNLHSPVTRGPSSSMGTDTRAGLSHLSFGRTTVIMQRSPLSLVEGTVALQLADHLETEFAKDCWDARNIPGLPYGPHSTQYYINFLHVPAIFRPLVKSYARFKFAEGRVALTLKRGVYCVGNFLTFLMQCYPHSTTLHDLSAHDVDAFIGVLKAEAEARRLKD